MDYGRRGRGGELFSRVSVRRIFVLAVRRVPGLASHGTARIDTTFPESGKGSGAQVLAPTGLRALDSSLKRKVNVHFPKRTRRRSCSRVGRPLNRLSPHAVAGRRGRRRPHAPLLSLPLASWRTGADILSMILDTDSTNLVALRKRMPYLLFLKRGTPPRDASLGVFGPRHERFFEFCRVGYSVRVGFGHRERPKSRGVSSPAKARRPSAEGEAVRYRYA